MIYNTDGASALQPTHNGISRASSQEGSQSVPQPGLSSVLAQYKSYLQSCYKARALAPADKYLPTLQAPYINLAMIKRGYYGGAGRDEFTRQTLHGGVDKILASKIPINIEDLLLPEEGSSDPVRFILVEGPPGIGKSTFAWEVCRRWDEIESLRNYHTVVLLKLKEKWVLNATNIFHLFRYPSDTELSSAIAKDLSETHGRKLLFVLDGFDEVSHSFHETSVIKSILCRQLLPECTIVLTTRPSAKHTLESVCQPQVDKHVEIIGFTEEGRVRYIVRVFNKELELQVNVFKYIFPVPNVLSMMYIPLNCAIIAQMYYESQQSSHHLAIPRTRTQLYKALTHSLLVRHMKMKESNHEYSDMLPEGLNKEDMEKFKILAKFAFDSYHKVESKKVTFFKEDIPEGLVHFGFLNESTEMYAGKGIEQTFSFLHLSLQEYLAAWHLAHSYSIEFQVMYHWLAATASEIQNIGLNRPTQYRGDSEEEKAFLQSITPLNEFLIEPAVFLAGITGFKCQSKLGINQWVKYLSNDTIGIKFCEVLLHSLYEAQNSSILSYYFNAEHSRGNFCIGFEKYNSETIEHFLSTTYDCYALSYFLAHSLNFKLRIALTIDEDASLLHSLIMYIKEQCLKEVPKVKYLRLNIINESKEVLQNTLSLLLKAKFLPEVEVFEYDSTLVNIDLTQEVLKSLPKLQSLKIVLYSTQNSFEWVAALEPLVKLKIIAYCLP